MKRTSKVAVHAALILVGVSVLVLAGGIIASNAGFVLTYSAAGASGSPASSLSGTNFIGLPYRQKTSLITARDLFNDMSPAIQILNKHRKSDDQFEFYTFGGGSIPPNGWNLLSGEGYIAKVSSGGTNYRIIGTHEPQLTVEFRGADGGVTSLSGSNFFAPPYHGVASTARELFLEIGGTIQIINQHRKTDDQFEFYSFGGGSLPPNGWNLTPGESYIVKVGANQRFQPLHY